MEESNQVPQSKKQENPSDRPGSGSPVALVGDVTFSGRGVIKAFTAAGIALRVLCASAQEEKEILDNRAALGDTGASQPALETVQGAVDSPEVLERLLRGVGGVVFLAPVGFEGRTWRGASHLDDLKRILAAALKAGAPQLAYLSTLAVDSQAQASCLKDTVAAENMVASSGLAYYIFRAGLLVGPGAEELKRVIAQARQSFPVLGIWGYGDTPVQPLHVDDLGRCMARCFLKNSEFMQPGIYSLAGQPPSSPLELTDLALAKAGRFKLKLHLPLFILNLAALVTGRSSTGGSLGERIRLLTAHFCAEHNDIPKLLGSQYHCKTIEETLNETLAG